MKSGINALKMPTWFAISIFFLLIYLTFIAWAQIEFGSYRYALSYIKGSRLQVWPAARSIGVHRPGESYQTNVTIRNHADSRVNVLGALADCSCLAYQGLPVTIEPGGSAELPVAIRFGSQAGDWRQSITYLTDDPHQPRLRAELTGVVRSP